MLNKMSLEIKLLGYVPLSIAIAGICVGFSVPCFKYAFTGRELGEKYSEGASKDRSIFWRGLSGITGVGLNVVALGLDAMFLSPYLF